MVVQEDGLSERQSVFAVLRQAELVPATVNDYREKLLHLRKLRHDVVQSAVPDGPLQEVKYFFFYYLYFKICLASFFFIYIYKREVYQVIFKRKVERILKKFN